MIILIINNEYGCPDCSRVAPWTLVRFIKRAHELHGNKYDYAQITEDHIKGIYSHVSIKCNTCENMWSPTIGSHISQKTGCSHCRFNNGYSQAALDWLKSIERENNIIIQYATSSEGEFKILSPNEGYYRVDGYHLSTNTVYEYYGDYWHGNPKIFNPNDINQRSGKTFGELYQHTIQRENYIKSLGFNLVTKGKHL